MTPEWHRVDVAKIETYHRSFENIGLAVSTRDGVNWDWGAFSYSTGLRIVPLGLRCSTKEKAMAQADEYYLTGKLP